jgi:hypothetical protein
MSIGKIQEDPIKEENAIQNDKINQPTTQNFWTRLFNSCRCDKNCQKEKMIQKIKSKKLVGRNMIVLEMRRRRTCHYSTGIILKHYM